MHDICFLYEKNCRDSLSVADYQKNSFKIQRIAIGSKSQFLHLIFFINKQEKKDG